ncbi:transcription factor TFIID (or TATA-binding protein, TBP) domain-containing protein [Ditylenchus destructor]|nr:transcription factor TFIID (or TATA-binding protein, TBP) domain-containing protein [Ditylenchus destructor]
MPFEIARRKFLQKIKQAGFDASLCDFAIQNIVATSKFGRPLNLAKISDWWNRNAYYEPQIFPGLTFRTSTGTVNMFGTGKVVITGTKNMDDMRKTWSTAYRAVYFVSSIVSPKDFL